MSKSPRPVVLAADDDENAHLLLKHAFSRAEFNAHLAQVNDGSEAIDYLAGNGAFSDRNAFPKPDLLLLDLKMPKISGFGVLEYLRKRSVDVPVIVFSCSSAAQDVDTAYDLGCTAYVVKPTSMDKLIELIRSIGRHFFPSQSSEAQAGALDFNRFIVRPSRPETEKPLSESTVPEVTSPSPAAAGSSDIFQLLVEQVKDYGIFMVDLEGKVLSWNEGARRMNGYEANEIVGKHFSIFYLQQDRESDKPNFELRMARDMGRYEEEGWRMRKDGSRFWASVVITPLRNSNGKLRGFAKIVRDLTQRKFQEDSLQRLLESEERFRLLVDQVKDYAIFILDAKGYIASWNQGARRLKGYTADEIMGKHFSTFYTPQDIARDHPAYELSLAIREGRYEEEGWRVRKDGSRFWANVVITSLWDKRGNLTGFAKVTRDLTARKQQEEALRRKSEELEAFAHTVSHDLRAPLRSIGSFAQILQTDAKGLTASERGFVDKIVRSALSMEQMISDILKLSEITATQVTEEIVSLEEVIDESLRMMEADVQRVKADIQIRKPLPTVKANRTLLLQIFSNLISNALKFTHDGKHPVIRISADTDNGKCDIHVEDSGIGIPEAVHKTIFNPFERGYARKGTSGTGIGLAVVKRAVERLGGSISLQSKAGQGSDFVVTLDCVVSEPIHVETK